MASEHGPFQNEREALSTPAAARIRAAFDAAPGVGASVPESLAVMTEACAECGVELGNQDLGFLRGVAWGETANAVSLAGMIRRAFEAGKAAGPDGTVTEWGVAYRPNLLGVPAVRIIDPEPSEYAARRTVASLREVVPQDESMVMRREVGPWKEAPEGETG